MNPEENVVERRRRDACGAWSAIDACSDPHEHDVESLMVRACTIFWVVVAVLLGCSRQSSERDSGTPALGAEAMSLVKTLDQMPDWTSISVNDPAVARHAEIESACREVAKHSTETIRLAFAYYEQNRFPDLAAEGKLFVLNRYLFDVPSLVRRDSPYFRLYGGWGAPESGEPRNPQPTDTLDLRWPWSVGPDGELRLTGHFGGYMGPPYDALGEFDFWSANFNRRKINGVTE
jgi:hypothetical protein